MLGTVSFGVRLSHFPHFYNFIITTVVCQEREFSRTWKDVCTQNLGFSAYTFLVILYT